MARKNRWMSALVPNRSRKPFGSELRTVDLERKCIDFDSWFQMNAHFYRAKEQASREEAKRDFEKWRNGFNPLKEKNRKTIFSFWRSKANEHQ